MIKNMFFDLLHKYKGNYTIFILKNLKQKTEIIF